MPVGPYQQAPGQLGQLETPPAWWPPGVPWPGDQPAPPGEVPLIVSEDECKRREAAAYDKGRADESARIVKVTIVSTAISVLVAGAIGYAIRR